MPKLALWTSIQCSTPTLLFQLSLYLDIFQGEPAISRLDWHFTPNHSSSERLAAHTGADLLPNFFGTHPDHGQIVWFRVQYTPLISPYSGSLSLRLRDGNHLSLRCVLTRWLILQQARDHPNLAVRLSRIDSRQFQVLFHQPSRLSFHLSLAVLVHYRSYCVFSLGAWSPQIPTRVCRL